MLLLPPEFRPTTIVNLKEEDVLANLLPRVVPAGTKAQIPHYTARGLLLGEIPIKNVGGTICQWIKRPGNLWSHEETWEPWPL